MQTTKLKEHYPELSRTGLTSPHYSCLKASPCISPHGICGIVQNIYGANTAPGSHSHCRCRKGSPCLPHIGQAWELGTGRSAW